jgi:hypothetical protein
MNVFIKNSSFEKIITSGYLINAVFNSKLFIDDTNFFFNEGTIILAAPNQ